MIELSRTSLRLAGLEIHWYALLIVAGILLGVAQAMRREARLGLPRETTLDLALAGVPAAIAGARLYYVAFSWRSFAGGPWWKVFAVWEGGLAIYGGLLGGVLAGWIYGRAKGLSFRALLDLAAPGFAIGQAVGRWGNFFNQEAHGGPVNVGWLRFFPAAVQIDGGWYYATFFYESAWCLLIAAALLYCEKRRGFARRGDVFLFYIFLYALERALVEGLRTDSLYFGPVRVSQALSLLAVLAAALAIARRAKAAPARLRWSGPVCAALAALLGTAGVSWGMTAAAAATLVAVPVTYFKTTQNRGEGL